MQECHVLVSGASDRPRTLEELLGPDLLPKLDRLDVMSRKVFAGKLPGERRSKRRGQSVEFEDYIQYAPGYDIRHIDWKVYARLDRLFVKIFQEEEDLALHIIVDASASMEAGRPNKLLFAQRVAMALGYIGIVNNNRVGLSVFGGSEIRRLAPARGRRNVQRLASFVLESIEPAAGPPGTGADFNEALRALAMASRGKGVNVLLSDFLIRDGYEEGLKYLAGARGHDTYCLQVLSPGEIDPSAEYDESFAGGFSGDLRLLDVETGSDAEVTVTAALIKRYRDRLESYCDALSVFCKAREMTHMVVRTDDRIDELLLRHLRRRGLLR